MINTQTKPHPNHSVKPYFLLALIAVIILSLIFFGTDTLVIRGVYSWASGTAEYHSMIIELLLYGLLLTLCLFLPKAPAVKLTAAAAAGAVFFWCHAVFLPMLVSGLYVLLICALGRLLNRCFPLETRASFSTDFLYGCAAVISLFCLMSALGIGAIPNLRLATGILTVCLILYYGKTISISFNPRLSRSSRPDSAESAVHCPILQNRLSLFMLAFILLMFLLQAGRMNISLDHDTLWYSVRSEYMLDNGPRGIYENMGTVSLVYTYSKGWEILTLLLSDLPSHSFLLAFNLWITALVLFTAWRIARRYDTKLSLLVPFLMASVPGIMNTGISGKTDNITLLFQLMFIHQLLLYLDSRRTGHLTACFGAILLSWTMKPTAIVFSTVIGIASALYLLLSRQYSLRSLLNIRAGIRTAAFPICLFSAALFAVWFRTWLFVGVPATSIFSGMFQKIGFTIRYPFLTWDLPSYGTKPTAAEAVLGLLKRLYGVFILPAASDMDRVLISWCSLSVLFFLLVWCASLFLPKKDITPAQRRYIHYSRCLLIPLILASIYSIYSLKKVDGNYFILLYSLSIIFGCTLLSRINCQSFCRNLVILFIPLTAFNTMMVSLSNLAWSVGFSKISFIHPGYFDHEQQQYEAMAAKGNVNIWEILAADPQNRVIAFGSHPEVLSFPCNVQSYIDISSSSGNELLIESTEAFQEYLDYAKTDYIYVEAGNMAEEYLGYGLLVDCIREGVLTDLYCEEGNILAVVDLQGEPGDEADENLEVFLEEYVVKEKD